MKLEDTSTDRLGNTYAENVGCEAAETLAAQGLTGELRTQTDNPLTYRGGLSDLDQLGQELGQNTDRKEDV